MIMSLESIVSSRIKDQITQIGLFLVCRSSLRYLIHTNTLRMNSSGAPHQQETQQHHKKSLGENNDYLL